MEFCDICGNEFETGDIFSCTTCGSSFCSECGNVAADRCADCEDELEASDVEVEEEVEE